MRQRLPKFTQDDLYRCAGCGQWRIRTKRPPDLAQCHTCRLRYLQQQIARLRGVTVD